jgi:hypothetical protein
VTWSARSLIGETDQLFEAVRARALGPPGAPRAGALDLTIAAPDRVGLVLPDYGAALARGAAHPYEPEPRGLEEARAAVAQSYASRLGERAPSAEDILLTASTSEAYLLALHLLCDPGDALLVPSPSYPLFEQLAHLAGVRLERYALRFAGGWQLDPGSLPSREEARARRIRAVVAVSPNNPTGSLLTPGELSRLAELELPLLIDEVFRAYVFPGAPEPPEPPEHGLLTLLLDGLSKRAAAPGLKLGWLAAVGGSVALRREALTRLELLADALLSVGGPVQRALPELLESEGRAQASVRARLDANRALLDRALAGSPATLLPVEGGWSATLLLPAVPSGAELWEQLADAGVFVQWGALYDLAWDGSFVVSLLTPEPILRAGLEQLLAVVAAAR